MNYDISVLKQIITTAAGDELLPRFADVQRNTKADGSFITEANLTWYSRVFRVSQTWTLPGLRNVLPCRTNMDTHKLDCSYLLNINKQTWTPTN